MSSRRLLALIDALPDDSAYWRERRDLDWSQEQYLQAAIVNELRRFRADSAAIHANHKLEVDFVNSPAQELQSEQAKIRHHDVRQHLMDGLLGKKNKTE